MAKDEAWGGEAVSQVIQQELKIVPWSPNRRKWCLLQIASSPAILEPWNALELRRLQGSGGCRCDVIGRRGCSLVLVTGGNDSPLLSPGSSWQVLGRTVSVTGYLQREVQISAVGLWPEQRLLLWLRWKVSLFFCRTLLHKVGKWQATSFHKTCTEKPRFNRVQKPNLPLASAAACQWCCLSGEPPWWDGSHQWGSCCHQPWGCCSEMVWCWDKHGGRCRKWGSALPVLERDAGVAADPY